MITERLYALLFALLITTTPSASQAQDFPPRGEKPNPSAMYSKIDADSNGCLTLDEFQNMRPSASGAHMGKRPENGYGGSRGDIFEKLDTDGDGMLSKDEFTAKPSR